MNPTVTPEILALRAKYGIPAEGYGTVQKSEDRVKEANDIWAKADATPKSSNDLVPLGREMGKEASSALSTAGEYAKKVSEGYKKSYDSLVNTGSDVIEGKATPASFALQAVGQGVPTLFQPFTSGIEMAVNHLADKISNNPTVQKIAQTQGVSNALDNIDFGGEKFSEWAQKNPELAKNIEAGVNTALAVVGSEGLNKPVGLAFKDAVNSVSNAIDKVAGTGSKVLEKLPDSPFGGPGNGTMEEAMVKGNEARAQAKIAGQESNASFDKRISEAQKIQNPYSKYNVTKNESLYGSGEIKGQGKGIFAKDVQAPKPNLQDEHVANLIDEGKVSSKNLPSKNIEAIKQEVRVTDSNIDNFLQKPELNQPFNQSAVDKAHVNIIDNAKKSNLFIPESSEQKAYEQIGEIFKKNIAEQPYNNQGLRNAIKASNEEVSRVLDTDIYKDAAGQPTSISQARVQAAKDFRSGYNEMLANNLDRAESINTLKNIRPNEAEPLIQKAENFPKKQDFVNSQREAFREKILNESSYRAEKRRIDSAISKGKTLDEAWKSEGLSMDVDSDLGEIWEIANTKTNPQSGSIYRNNLQKEAQLLNATDSIGYNSRANVGKTRLQIFVKQHPIIAGAISGGGTSVLLRKFLGI